MPDQNFLQNAIEPEPTLPLIMAGARSRGRNGLFVRGPAHSVDDYTAKTADTCTMAALDLA
jgi:hypothetical protein